MIYIRQILRDWTPNVLPFEEVCQLCQVSLGANYIQKEVFGCLRVFTVYSIPYPATMPGLYIAFLDHFKSRFQAFTSFTFDAQEHPSCCYLSILFVEYSDKDSHSATISHSVLIGSCVMVQVIKGSYLDWRPEGSLPDLAVHNNSIEDYEDKKTVD